MSPGRSASARSHSSIDCANNAMRLVSMCAGNGSTYTYTVDMSTMLSPRKRNDNLGQFEYILQDPEDR